MKIIFFGTPDFAANNLKHLIKNNYDIVAVVTSPDTKAGRGKKIKPSAVKDVAKINSIPIIQPEKLKSDIFITKLKDLNADLFIIVAFRMLPEIVWKIPKKGSMNLHTSLLPNYRGAAPINWVLINGENETGVSTFFINNEIDSGEIIKQKSIQLTNSITAAQLYNTLIKEGNKLIIDSIDAIKHNSTVLIPQTNYNNKLKAPKLKKELLKINWEKSAFEIHNLVRGLSPFYKENIILKNISICPAAWFILESPNGKQKRIKLHLTKVIKAEKRNLLCINTDNKSYLNIHTKNGIISILNLQAEGKKPMTIQQFLQGNKITHEHQIK